MANLWRYDKANDKWVKVSEDDPLPVVGELDVDINTSDIEIGSVELKDATTDQRASIDSTGAIKVVEKTPLTSIEVTSVPNLDSDADSVSIPSPSSIGDGNKTVTTAGTAVALASSTACQYVTITALLANTGLISVGGATTTPSSTVRGDVLAAGDNTTVLIDNISKVYINSTVNGEGVSYRYG